jgi:hypothetical protein
MKANKRKIATLCLMIAMFLNPIGFDVAFAMVMKMTGSYWITTAIFYLLSALFFGVYFYLVKVNPFKEIKDRFLSLKKIKTK